MGKRIAVLGRSDTVPGFGALGFDVFTADGPEEAKRAFREIARPEAGYAIVYVEELFAEALAPQTEKLRSDPALAVILIPGREGSSGKSLEALRAAVEKAVGIDISGDQI